MISVIVPVYNVKPYLRKCLDSIINQTYRDLEILIIDDGSTDGSGDICDEYRKDERVKVFHTENRGLSAARNLGLDNATGDWIGFVDSDDWIELDMYEVLLRKAEKTGADVVECGYQRVSSDKKVIQRTEEFVTSGADAVLALLQLKISDNVWNKIWKYDCYRKIRFPVSRVYEDDATTYKVFYHTYHVCIIPAIKYNYRERKGSLSRQLNIENLVGYWRSHKERYDFLIERIPDISDLELEFCAKATARTWAHYYDCNKKQRRLYGDDIRDMNTFTRNYLPLFGRRNWKLRLRVGVFFPHFDKSWSFGIAWKVNTLVSKLLLV